ncbi:hypothetical protein N9H21_02820 [bacterium]|nr:hypothetical protein [bacterium]|tara:strand:- start:309 stop:488 length:180 start_codon:yes stop_codon:yes gene_type:complete
MEIDAQGYLMILVVILSFIPVIAGVIKRSKEAEEKHLQGIRRVEAYPYSLFSLHKIYIV